MINTAGTLTVYSSECRGASGLNPSLQVVCCHAGPLR